MNDDIRLADNFRTFTKFVLFSDNSGVDTGIETKRSAGSQTRLVGEDNSIFQNIWIPADGQTGDINKYLLYFIVKAIAPPSNCNLQL